MSSLFTHCHDFWYYRISLHVFALHIYGIIQYAFFFLSPLTPICYFKNHPNSCIYLEFVNFYCSLCKIHSMQCLWLEMESYAFSDKEASWVQYFKSWNHLSWSHPYPYDLILVTRRRKDKHFLWLLLVSRCSDGSPCKAHWVLLTGFPSTHRRNGLSVPPPTGVRCWEAAYPHHFLLLGKGYKMPLIFPSPQGLKLFHFSLPTLQHSPFLCLSLVPLFTVELSREEQREMSLWSLVWFTGFHQYRNRLPWSLSSQRMEWDLENKPLSFMSFIFSISLP